MSHQLEIKVPTLGESVTEATVARWLKAAGDSVRTDEALVELETDKVTLEVPAPAGGILESIFANKGSVVKIGGILGLIRKEEAQTVSLLEDEGDLLSAPDSTSSAQYPPSVQKLLSEHNLNPSLIPATGKGGRLTKGDIIDYFENKSFEPTPEGVPLECGSRTKEWTEETEREKSEERLEKRVPMSRLRQRVAERLKQAQNTAATLTTFNEVDMSAIMDLRSRYKDAFEKKYEVKLGFMSFFVKACVHALKEIPMMNSQIEGDEIVHKNYYDIGIAVSAPQGLVVPVLRDADSLGYAEVEKKIAALGQKAKNNNLSMGDLSGGTFTISNGGIFGSLLSTPILNPPQSGILGMHKIQDRPIAVSGRIEIRPMMYLALSYDHRLIDGREAVTFLVQIKECIENPGRFLLDL